MRREIFLLPLFFLLSCIQNPKNIKKLTDENDIETMMISLLKSKYSYLVNYIFKNPAKLSINPDSSIDCPIINNEGRVLLVPRKPYQSITLKTAYLAKSLYEYMIRTKYKIYDEIPLEVKILSSYLEIEFITNHISDDVISEIKGTPLQRKICAYIMDEGSFEKILKDEEYTYNKACSRPSVELAYYKDTANKLKRSLEDVNSDNFFRVLHDIEMEKAKRKNMSYQQAYRDYYYSLSEPEMELYRNIRREIYSKIRSLNLLSSFYKKEIKKFKKNRQNSKSLLENLTFCSEINKI